MRPTLATILLTAFLGLALAPAAGAETALEQYQRTGRIDPCTATGGPGDIPSDVEQYAPDFLEAYNAARRARCNSGNVSQTRPTEQSDAGVPVASDGQALPPGATYVPKPPAPPRTVRGTGREVRHLPLSVEADTRTPLPLLALGVMLALALIGAGLAATARYMGWGLDRLDPVRHSLGEARVRSGDAAAGVADRLRALVRRGA